MIPSLLRLQGAVVTIRAATGLGQRTFDLVDDLEAGPEVATEPQPFAVDVGETTPMAGADLVPSIRLQDVSYSYPGGGREVVRGISLDVNPGSSLALVGESGAGKSTIADLILGILEPHQGSVRIGGVAPAEAISRWPGAVGYVPQQVTMIRGSVRDNVALGVAPAEVDDAAVWRALDAVHLSPFLREHRQGLDTEVGERGARFSGGQMQRIGIARALYSTPRLLLLDEATSALDAESEHAISEILRGLNGEVTVVVIAHRLATVRSCERVAYLQGGQLVGVGTFSEVRASVAEFDRQVRLQDFSENPGSG
jgi:ABC-type multidrug transport system fused ATPase/permease subunit